MRPAVGGNEASTVASPVEIARNHDALDRRTTLLGGASLAILAVTIVLVGVREDVGTIVLSLLFLVLLVLGYAYAICQSDTPPPRPAFARFEGHCPHCAARIAYHLQAPGEFTCGSCRERVVFHQGRFHPGDPAPVSSRPAREGGAQPEQVGLAERG